MEANTGWIAVGIAAVSMIGTSFGLLMNYLTKRTDMQIAVNTAVMNAQIVHQGEQIKTLKEELANCQEQHASSEADRNTLRERLDHLQDLIEKQQSGE